jgi:hypothetical protein
MRNVVMGNLEMQKCEAPKDPDGDVPRTAARMMGAGRRLETKLLASAHQELD